MASMELLRGVLGVLCLFFAFQFGRGAARAYERRPRPGYRGWMIRLVLCMVAVAFRRGLDLLTVVTLVFSAAALAAGAWLEMRPKPPQEDLTRTMFGGKEE